MTPRERMTLSPLAKWRRFGRFPMKLLLHVVALVLLVTTISLTSLQFTPYTRACQDTFSRVFVPTPNHYTVNESIHAIRNAAAQYFDFPSRSINRWQFVTAHDDGFGNASQAAPAVLKLARNIVVSYDAQARAYNFSTPVIVHERYLVRNASVLEPFEGLTGAALDEFVFTLETAQLEFTYFNVAEGPLGTMPVMWNMTCAFDFTGDGGVMHASIDLRETLLGPAELPPGTSVHTLDVFLWLNCIGALVVAVSLVLNVLELRRGYRMYQRVKLEFPKGVMLADHKANGGQRIYTSWANVPLDVKVQFFNVWSVVVIVGSALVVVANVFGVMTSFGYGGVDNDVYHALLGSGAFFYSLAFIRYLDYVQNLLVLTLTVKMAMSRVMYMFISVMPIFCGYLMLGVILFARYSLHFSNMSETAVTLFSLLNGDNIHDTFDDLNRSFPYQWLPRIYVFSFVAFFITVVLNTLIFIVEDAFTNSKRWVWNDPAQIGARRPFDICELFDIIDARQAQSRRNLTSYFRQRAQGAVGPAAQARMFAAATATQLQLPSLTGSSEDVPYSFVSNNLPSLRASFDVGAASAASSSATGAAAAAASGGAPAAAASDDAIASLESRLARMELQQQQLFDVILSLKAGLPPRTGSIN
jgi:hypothetical protein